MSYVFSFFSEDANLSNPIITGWTLDCIWFGLNFLAKSGLSESIIIQLEILSQNKLNPIGKNSYEAGLNGNQALCLESKINKETDYQTK